MRGASGRIGRVSRYCFNFQAIRIKAHPSQPRSFD